MTARDRLELPIRLVVCDMAGTTIEDTGVVPVAFDAALAAHGMSATAAELSAVRGAAKRDAIRQLVRERHGSHDLERLSDAVYERFRGELDRRFREGGARPVEGAAHMFEWLRAHGIALALNTGFDRDTQQRVLGAVGWLQGVADALVCGDDVSLGRPAPYMIFRAMELTGVTSVRQVVNIGDTVLDLQSGRNAGVGLNVGVWSGAHRREQLLQEPGAHLLASVAALPTFLQNHPGALA